MPIEFIVGFILGTATGLILTCLAAVWNWDYVKVKRVKSVKNVRRKNKK